MLPSGKLCKGLPKGKYRHYYKCSNCNNTQAKAETGQLVCVVPSNQNTQAATPENRLFKSLFCVLALPVTCQFDTALHKY